MLGILENGITEKQEALFCWESLNKSGSEYLTTDLLLKLELTRIWLYVDSDALFNRLCDLAQIVKDDSAEGAIFRILGKI